MCPKYLRLTEIRRAGCDMQTIGLYQCIDTAGIEPKNGRSNPVEV